MTEPRLAKVGQHVVFHDEKGVAHDALATRVWGEHCINLLYVLDDESREDQYGRQIERRSSCCHASYVQAHGNYWRFPDQQPNTYHAPVA